MKYPKLTIIVFYCLFSLISIVISVQNSDFTKMNFQGQNNDIKKDLCSINIQCELMVSDLCGGNPDALDFLFQANSFNPKNAKLNFEIAI